jgi:sRNA-binding protein
MLPAWSQAARYVAGVRPESPDTDGTPTTKELKHEQAVREAEENARLAESDQPEEARQHERRSEKAAYLKGKLEERERAEREATGDR